MADRNPKVSFFVRVGWWFAAVLAGVAAFAGTGPGYHATVDMVFDFALEQYGDLVAFIVVWLWWVVVAALLFLLSLMAIVLAFVIAVFAVKRWFD